MKIDCDPLLGDYSSTISRRAADTALAGKDAEAVRTSGNGSPEAPGSDASVNPSDAELISRYLDKGSEDAFAMLVQRYQTMVIGTAFRRTRNLELARDVAQEVFTTLIRKLPGLVDRSSLGGWLHQAAIFQSVRVLEGEERRQLRNARFAADAPASTDPAMFGGPQSEKLHILNEVMGTLSPADQEILILHYFEELSHTEISRLLGVNEPAVRQRVSRAVNRLSKRLKERGVADSAIVLLASAAGIQSSIAAPVGVVSLAAVTKGGAPGSFLLSSVLSQTVLKGAAAVVVASAGIVTGWQLTVESRSPEPEFVHSVTVEEAGRVRSEDSREGAATIQGETKIQARTLAANSGDTAPVGRENANQADLRIPRVSAPAKMAVPGQQARPLSSASDTSNIAAANKNRPPTAPTSESSHVTPNASANGTMEESAGVQNRFRRIVENGGVPALVNDLQSMEMVPAEAAATSGEVVAKVLALDPVKQLQLEELLFKHFENLKDLGLAGVKPAEITKDAWQFARQEVIDSTLQEVGSLLPGVTEGATEVVNEVLSLPTTLGETKEVLSLPETLGEVLEEPVQTIVEQPIVSAIVEPTKDVLSEVLEIVAPGIPLLRPRSR